MNSDSSIYRTGFGDQAFEITCNNDDAYTIADFLFRDFPGTRSAKFTKQYAIASSEAIPKLTLRNEKQQLYIGASRYQLAYILMNDVIFHCIDNNDSQHALHAGAVCREEKCIILPGGSGNGKSTLTSWLILNGFQYLTDELVFLSSDGKVLPLTRPISLKVGPSHESWLLEEDNDDFIVSEAGSMIPHRMFNSTFKPQQPKITDIVFPHFKQGVEPELQEISAAISSLYLLQSHVNARNLSGHGVSDMASIVKQCKSFKLSYSNFDDLHHLINSGFGLIS